MSATAKRFLVIDSNSLLHRAFHALPSLKTKDGRLVNAVYGFLLVFLKAINDFHPDFVAACFDYPGATFRHKEFQDYKAKRPPTPEGLIVQVPNIKKVLEAFSVPIFEKKGFEADDLIGTIISLAKREEPKMENIILSGDQDMLQLIGKNVGVNLLKRGVKETLFYDENVFKKHYGNLEAKQLVDFKGLTGDASDNIPGVTGIGRKTAISLLLQFHNLENLYKAIEKNTKEAEKLPLRIKKLLREQKKQAFLSKELAKIRTDVPLNFKLEKCCWGHYNKSKLANLFSKLGFHSLIKRLSLNSQPAAGMTLSLW